MLFYESLKLVDKPCNSYSTKFELFLDFIGLIAAAAAGAAQVSSLCIARSFLLTSYSLLCPSFSEK